MFSIGQTLRVKFLGGREVKGILKSQDSGAVKEDASLLKCTTMVLDDAIEFLKNEDGDDTGKTRKLGLVIVRANMATSVTDEYGYEEIDNPYQDNEQ